MPVYNEGEHIYDNLLEASRIVGRFAEDYEIVAVNDELDDSPEKINEDAFAAWIVEIKTSDDLSDLISAADYKAFVEA